MCVKDSSIGRLIDRLERDGMLRRVRSEEDRRVIFVEMTDAGIKLFKELLCYGEEFNNQLTKGISQEDLNTFANVLESMLTNIKE